MYRIALYDIRNSLLNHYIYKNSLVTAFAGSEFLFSCSCLFGAGCVVTKEKGSSFQETATASKKSAVLRRANLNAAFFSTQMENSHLTVIFSTPFHVKKTGIFVVWVLSLSCEKSSIYSIREVYECRCCRPGRGLRKGMLA